MQCSETNGTELQVHLVRYHASSGKALLLLQGLQSHSNSTDYNMSLQTLSKLQLPTNVSAHEWDVLIVDGPSGAPHGRMEAMWAAKHLMAPGAEVIVHDAERDDMSRREYARYSHAASATHGPLWSRRVARRCVCIL